MLRFTLQTALLCLALLPARTGWAQGADCAGWLKKEFWAEATVEDVQECIAEGANSNAKAEYGITPLDFAANQSTDPSVIFVLLDAGADPNARDELGFTPLHWAALNNANPEVIVVLLDAGAGPNAQDESGYTPLHSAALANPVPGVTAALLDAGADGSIINQFGKTPFDLAREHNEGLRGTDVWWRLNDARFGD